MAILLMVTATANSFHCACRPITLTIYSIYARQRATMPTPIDGVYLLCFRNCPQRRGQRGQHSQYTPHACNQLQQLASGCIKRTATYSLENVRYKAALTVSDHRVTIRQRKLRKKRGPLGFPPGLLPMYLYIYIYVSSCR